MTEYITISSIGVSKESQFRAAKIIEEVCNGTMAAKMLGLSNQRTSLNIGEKYYLKDGKN